MRRFADPQSRRKTFNQIQMSTCVLNGSECFHHHKSNPSFRNAGLIKNELKTQQQQQLLQKKTDMKWLFREYVHQGSCWTLSVLQCQKPRQSSMKKKVWQLFLRTLRNRDRFFFSIIIMIFIVKQSVSNKSSSVPSEKTIDDFHWFFSLLYFFSNKRWELYWHKGRLRLLVEQIKGVNLFSLCFFFVCVYIPCILCCAVRLGRRCIPAC